MTTFIRSSVAVDPAAVVADYGPMANAVIDLNYETGRFWYDGTAYASVAAIISAGHGDATGGVNRLTLPTLSSGFSVYAVGVTGTPAAAYLLSLDDGSDSVAADNMLTITQAVDEIVSVLMYSGSTEQLGTNIRESGAGANGLDLSVALRVKANDMAGSFNGGAIKTDTSATLPSGLVNLVVGNRDDGTRPWGGTIKRIVVIDDELTNAELVALAA